MTKLKMLLSVLSAAVLGALGGTFSDGDALAALPSYQPSVWGGDPGGCAIGTLRTERVVYYDQGGSWKVTVYQCVAPGYWVVAFSYWEI